PCAVLASSFGYLDELKLPLLLVMSSVLDVFCLRSSATGPEMLRDPGASSSSNAMILPSRDARTRVPRRAMPSAARRSHRTSPAGEAPDCRLSHRKPGGPARQGGFGSGVSGRSLAGKTESCSRAAARGRRYELLLPCRRQEYSYCL